MTGTTGIHTCRQFLDEVAIPDYNDYVADLTNLRAAMHAALSHFHLHEWVFEEHKDNPSSVFNCTNTETFKGYLISPICEDFGLIKDVANAHKHFLLTRGDPSITGAQDVTLSPPTGWGEGGYGEGPWGGSPAVVIDMGSGPSRDFFTALKNVHEMWTELFLEKGW